MIAHLIAGNMSDLEVAMGYLRISKSIKDLGEIRSDRGVYICTVRLAKPFKDVAHDIASRFGRFVQLRKN
jgi:hypothetical protein